MQSIRMQGIKIALKKIITKFKIVKRFLQKFAKTKKNKNDSIKKFNSNVY